MSASLGLRGLLPLVLLTALAGCAGPNEPLPETDAQTTANTTMSDVQTTATDSDLDTTASVDTSTNPTMIADLMLDIGNPCANCPAGTTCCNDTCVDLSQDLRNCGSCGTLCSPPGVATSTCLAGSCAIVTCQPGLEDCDNDVANGCEANLDTGLQTCGACAAVCEGSRCESGQCINDGVRDQHRRLRRRAGQRLRRSTSPPTRTTAVDAATPAPTTRPARVGSAAAVQAAHAAHSATASTTRAPRGRPSCRSRIAATSASRTRTAGTARICCATSSPADRAPRSRSGTATSVAANPAAVAFESQDGVSGPRCQRPATSSCSPTPSTDCQSLTDLRRVRVLGRRRRHRDQSRPNDALQQRLRRGPDLRHSADLVRPDALNGDWDRSGPRRRLATSLQVARALGNGAGHASNREPSSWMQLRARL